ncbi:MULTISPECIES: nitroreductase/quinone reductase family protein [unclassified Streptomyces]|uniref:nitroreductase/quinone reductase family protein n=1 Tax=unclassified Streptomyces TaxID=2593676 RepID=UPI000F4EA0FC|nr:MULTISPECIES: nitroreductase/quinone reductase family protein [unclassified Streptomyces]MDH6451111.1 deazaflavin-dependent oxidoreductase (nitroreductase family) [Streptomyces sp. SAI-119]MDH6498334.1 deazaflavin-dependent oxidoreductase (nitroreductase family) [Streptomyces sp. SAI-149]
MPNPFQDFNQRIIDEFRANHGRVGGPFEGGRLILLTTTGARTGTPHTTPVGYLPDGGDRILVIASAGGSPRHPDWYRNLVAHPQVTVESGVFTYEARAVVLVGEERDRAFARAVESDRGWAAYQEKTERVIPVVALHEIARPGPPNINASSPGEAIRLVHDVFRRELALIREEMATGGSTLGAQLRVNCLTFCQGLHNHHSGEDQAMFPFLAERHPEAAPALARLRAEHEHIAALVEELRKALAGSDPASVRSEVTRLTTDLEAHLTYEEEQLLPLLDGA